MNPRDLAKYYSRFQVGHRLLLNGHSHQAWPDRAFQGQVRAYEDAALYLDEKWERAFILADRVREGFRKLTDDPNGFYALSSNTHDLMIRFLSGLPLVHRPRIVTTDGEFHSMRRQLQRLEEEGIEVVWVPTDCLDVIVPKLIEAVDSDTAVVMVSSVLYQSGHIIPHLDQLASACDRSGAQLLVDTYHSLNVVPFSIQKLNLDQAYVLGGGYKYCQLGEGNCFLRFPKECKLRPVITGWFSELFDALNGQLKLDQVSYPSDGNRFSGSTYDPTSHYRAAEVFDFFTELNLGVQQLRELNQEQISFLIREFDSLDADPKIIRRDQNVTLEQIGGFLGLYSPYASELRQRLFSRGVLCDFRGEVLRLGPAPYVTQEQMCESLSILAEEITHFNV